MLVSCFINITVVTYCCVFTAVTYCCVFTAVTDCCVYKNIWKMQSYTRKHKAVCLPITVTDIGHF